MVEHTKPEIVKLCCSKCGEMKNPDRIVRNRNICKDCCNKKRKENYHNKVVDDTYNYFEVQYETNEDEIDEKPANIKTKCHNQFKNR